MSFFSNLFSRGPKVDLGQLIRDGAAIVDVRSTSEFAGGHVKGSLNIPLDQLGRRVSSLKKDKPVITCCASGMRSGVAARQLRELGFTVHNGGGWSSVQRLKG
jgi:phage shock protein E